MTSRDQDPLDGSRDAVSGVDKFEAAYRELLTVVGSLEHGGLSLEESVRLFERGSRLAKLCERIVDEAELRVTRLIADDVENSTDRGRNSI